MTVQPAGASIPKKKSWRHRLLRWLRLLLIALIFVALMIPFSMGYATIWGLTHTACYAGSNPGSFNPAYQEVNFTSTNGLKEQGYFIPGTNGATIINVPTFGSGRGAQLDYALVFNQAGFNVLTFNSRVCTSQGWISLGYQEVEDVQAAYNYLLTRPDVDVSRVGLHGFSSAEATAIMAAARMPQIRSVTAEGGYHDYADALGLYDNYGDPSVILYQWGVMVGYRLITGDDIHVLSPISVIDRLAGRRLLLIYGSKEVSLPGAKLMLAKAQASGVLAELWIVPGADHGDYLRIDMGEYIRRVVSFHQAALVGEN